MNFINQVLNKGKIIAAERLDVSGQVITSVGLTVTPEMMPSFRFVAYYTIPWVRGEELVADSIWVDVADSCVGKVSAQTPASQRRSWTTRSSLHCYLATPRP